MTDAGCFICGKHRGEFAVAGGFIADDPLLFASHRWQTPDGIPDDVYLGHVFIETRRHVPAFADLSSAEAQAVGLLASRLSAAMKATLAADYVFAAVIGRGVAHFHLHLLAHYPQTPAEVPWHEAAEWAEGPRGGYDEVAAVTARLAAALG